MTYDERRAIRILISEARKRQVDEAHGRRGPTCEWCNEGFTPTNPKIAQAYCTKKCRDLASQARVRLAKGLRVGGGRWVKAA